MRPVVCAVDVGTGSARAGIFDHDGNLLGRADAPIDIRQVRAGEAEHDSEQIWQAVCQAVRAARTASGVSAEAISAIGFDATCSLVVRGADGARIPVSSDGEARWDTIAWHDHRAMVEADELTATAHPALSAVGGTMSPEMQLPKLMWLKRRLPATWLAAEGIFDLADFLACRASGLNLRSINTLTCKWLYAQDEPGGWPTDLLGRVDLADMKERAELVSPPIPVGSGPGFVKPNHCAALGLSERCRVAVGMVDAYAGALGTLGHLPERRLSTDAALIAGTSSCVMLAAAAPHPLPSVWGPFRDAALPGRWMSEAGQSATGALLDHLIRLHGLVPSEVTHSRICERIAAIRNVEGPDFAPRLHVLPDFHGNRSPFGDPHALGVIHGLPLDSSFDGLCRFYWRTCVAIAMGVRHIVETLRDAGNVIETLHVAGGHLRNPLLTELYANALNCRVTRPAGPDAVLLGTAIAAATCAGLHQDLTAASRAMIKPALSIDPDPGSTALYDRDYRIFLEMHRHRQQIDALSAPR
ncbi:MAG: FGGY family pentulose kinase [Rhizobiaceae bacterium]|nr:FGGY family pentulose kinase [Rhizobiaceae bacterium]